MADIASRLADSGLHGFAEDRVLVRASIANRIAFVPIFNLCVFSDEIVTMGASKKSLFRKMDPFQYVTIHTSIDSDIFSKKKFDSHGED